MDIVLLVSQKVFCKEVNFAEIKITEMNALLTTIHYQKQVQTRGKVFEILYKSTNH